MSHTKEMAAREAKNNFGELLDSAQDAPVSITRNGRRVAVLLSEKDYRLFEKIEDAVWSERVREAMKNPEFIGVKESEALLKRILRRNAGA